jgi:hypothetical protein
MALEEIQFQTPQELPPLKKRKKELVEFLGDCTMEYLRNAYKSLFGRPSGSKNKGDLINETAEALAFPSGAEFQEWFCAFPALTQKILYQTTFEDYIPVIRFQRESKEPLIIQDSRYSWRPEWRFKPELRLDFFPLQNHYGCPLIALPRFLYALTSIWLVPPPLICLSACRIHEQSLHEGDLWNNSLTIADTYPLLCDALRNSLGETSGEDREKLLRNGFKKREIHELRTSTGFPPFSLGTDHAPDSVDLAARFILCMYNGNPQRPDDGQEGVRSLIEAFFNKKSRYPQKWYAPDRNYLEYTICVDHFSRTAGYYLENVKDMPASREIFREILQEIAQDGGWFDADKLAEHIRITGKDFAFCKQNLEKAFKIKAETLEIQGVNYFEVANDEFHPDGIMRFYLLVRPLFKAYCYIFAALGLLEIIQETPPFPRQYREKRYHLTPYDSLKALRITEFGRWCLGLSDKRPPRPPREYHAIADRELFLVTVQGNSLERRVYLDKIGQKLGEDRWRISPASFIAGCTHERQIAERIERFKALIDPNPAPHWEQLFQKVLQRAGLFGVNRSDMLVYDLPEDQEITQELLRDPELKHLAWRAEGRMLVVASKDQRKFFALLSEHGIAHF